MYRLDFTSRSVQTVVVTSSRDKEMKEVVPRVNLTCSVDLSGESGLRLYNFRWSHKSESGESELVERLTAQLGIV